jgi:hypothetical protein
MQSVTLLQTLTQKSCPSVHKKRSDCLFDVVTSLISGGQLWISALGRSVKNNTTAKHNIKKVDTLVGNRKLHQDRLLYYKFTTNLLLEGKTRPAIIVDWSPVSGDCEHYFLRASVTGIGRTLTLYEEVHEEKHYANQTIHKNFLKTLYEIVPAMCRPIIVSDAGFRNPWFKAVTALGWDFIGRLRYNTHVQCNQDSGWQGINTYHSQATSTPKYLGELTIAKSNPFAMNVYIMKNKNKNRIKKTKVGKKCQSSNSKKYAKGANEPWVIVTSLSHKHSSAKNVMKLYQYRMQIEESFRDLKDKRYGFRLPESGTKNVMRIENLLLIAMLATVAVWLAGQVAINNNWHYQLQANTVRHKAVLSIAFIGLHVLRDQQYYKLKKHVLVEAIDMIRSTIIDGENYDCA